MGACSSADRNRPTKEEYDSVHKEVEDLRSECKRLKGENEHLKGENQKLTEAHNKPGAAEGTVASSSSGTQKPGEKRNGAAAGSPASAYANHPKAVAPASGPAARVPAGDDASEAGNVHGQYFRSHSETNAKAKFVPSMLGQQKSIDQELQEGLRVGAGTPTSTATSSCQYDA